MVLLTDLTDKVKAVSNKVSSVLEDVDSERDEVQRNKKNQDRNNLEDEIESQRNIFEEFEDTEADLMQVLKADKEEINDLIAATEQTIELEEEVKKTTIAFGEEFDELLSITNDLHEKLVEGRNKYVKRVTKQAIDLGFEGFKDVLTQAENHGLKTGRLKNELRRLIIGRDKRVRVGDKLEDYPSVNFERVYNGSDEDRKRLINLALELNPTLYELSKIDEVERECVDRTRFKVMEGELPELKQLVEKFQGQEGILGKLEDIKKKEEEIGSELQTEMDEFPKSIDDLKEIGADINSLRNSIEKEKLTEAEIEKSISRMTSSDPEAIHQEANNEIAKIEQNLSNLEEFEEEIAEEAVRLEEEHQRIETLTEKEEENLRKVVREAEKVKSNIEEIVDSLRSGKISLIEENERSEFKERKDKDIGLRMEFESNLRAISKVVDKFESQSEEVLEYLNREEREELELIELEKTEFSNMKELGKIASIKKRSESM